MIDLIDVKEAAEILGLGGTQTRAVLGEPDEIDIISTGQAKHLFFRCRVEETRRRRECEQCRKSGDKGKRSCYHCRNRYPECELTSGLCAKCQAAKLVKNFACHGNCCKCPVDCSRLRILAGALAKFQLEAVGQAK
ncbi:MAG: hypothetical protein HPZ91_07640 [Lentisphaeria bacterium]|nr:hypothetical protein [Lentisphaeria bacterium]